MSRLNGDQFGSSEGMSDASLNDSAFFGPGNTSDLAQHLADAAPAQHTGNWLGRGDPLMDLLSATKAVHQELTMKAAPLTEGTTRWGGIPERSRLKVPPSWRAGYTVKPYGGQSTWRDPTPNWTSQPMFMSTNEILESHRPLEGDRENRGTWIGHRRYDPPAGQSAWGDFATSSEPPPAPSQPGPGERGRTAGGGQLLPLRGERKETDEELWSRKLSEAESYSEHDRYTPAGESVGRGSKPSRSLADAVRAEGVAKPVSLSVSQFGDTAKPQIVGGHHRLAVMKDHDPDALLPVLRFRSISEAQHGNTGYRYT